MLKFRVITDSMTPLIPIGAKLEVKKIDCDYKFKKFDILLFEIDNKLYCHFFWHQNKYIDKGRIVTRSLKDGKRDYSFEQYKIIGLVENYKIGLFLKLKIFMQ